MADHVSVRVNEDLVLDAGTCEHLDASDRQVLLRPPGTTLFQQVLAFLWRQTDPAEELPGSPSHQEGVAAAAVTLRWGSYLAVLLDHKKPIWSEVRSKATSRISDEEMARINIEASAALAEWVDLRRSHRNAYTKLVARALYYLPMPAMRPKLKFSDFLALADPEISARLIEACDAPYLKGLRTDSGRFATRIFTNALINHAWRNGPVEGIHGGDFQGYPLDQRRVSAVEERLLMSFASDRLSLGMAVCEQFAIETPRRPWCEQVLPYGLAGMLLITPTRWTLTEASREVRLPVEALSNSR